MNVAVIWQLFGNIDNSLNYKKSANELLSRRFAGKNITILSFHGAEILKFSEIMEIIKIK